MESNKKDQSIDTQANTVVKQADIIANLQKQLSWLSIKVASKAIASLTW